MITIAVNVTDIIICTKSHFNNITDIYIRDIKHLSKLNFCTSVNVTDIIISAAKWCCLLMADSYIGVTLTIMLNLKNCIHPIFWLMQPISLSVPKGM